MSEAPDDDRDGLHSSDEAFFRRVFDAAPDAILVVDHTGRIRMVNQQSDSMFGYPRGELLGQPVELLISFGAATRHVHNRANYFVEPHIRQMGVGLDLFARRKDATMVPVDIVLGPLKADEGDYVLCVVRDMTARRRAEEKFRSLMETGPDAMVIVDAAGKIRLVNALTERLFGYARADLLGQPVDMLIPERFGPHHRGHMGGYFDNPRVRPMDTGRELYARRSDGTEFPAEISLSPLKTEEGTFVCGAIRDVSLRTRAAERAAFLVAAGTVLGNSLDYQTTLKTVASLAVPYVADLCEVLVVRDDKSVERIAVAAVPEKIALAETIRERYDDPSLPDTAASVMRGGAPVLVAHLSDAMIVAAAHGDEERVRLVRALGITSYICVPMTARGRILGAMTFATTDPARRYTDDDLLFAQEIASRAALAVENAWAYHSIAADSAANLKDAQRFQGELREERDRLRLLLEVNNLLVSRLEYPDLLQTLSRSLQHLVRHDAVSIALIDRESGQLRLEAMTGHGGRDGAEPHVPLSPDGSPEGVTFVSGVARVFRRPDLDRFAAARQGAPAWSAEAQSVCCVPLVTLRGRVGTLNVASADADAFQPEEIGLLTQISSQLAIAVENAVAFHEITGIKEQLAGEKQYLEEEIRLEHDFSDIIGTSPALKRVLRAVETVAPTDATVLLRGETGTGKEMLARAIHQLSPRRDRTFVRLSMAALPVALIESELFGFERGAFTGAMASKIGRLELANHGTLFLDEVGDIPPEVQPKLLRALQEREFERLGSTRTQHVDVRLIAATNRDLEQLIADGLFREDLYYRLNVFPVHLPPLRDRPEDIPALVHHFVEKFARPLKRNITTVAPATMRALQNSLWPGNIRELENVVERAVILSTGPELKVPLAALQAAPSRKARRPETPAAQHDVYQAHDSTAVPGDLANAERELILKALRDSRGVIGGPDGAAATLGLKRTTLQSKMLKLGLTRPSF